MKSIITISALNDNYIYLYPYAQNKAFVVDPSDSIKTQNILKGKGLDLTHILVTHHHWDHIAGVAELKKATGCEVISHDRTLSDAENITIGKIRIRAIATPGHTKDSFCYFLPRQDNNPPIVFTGDTLFICSCGRLLECDAKTMFNSLQKLTALPDDTLVYPGHDYTIDNYQFALSLEPENEILKQRLSQAEKLQQQYQPTVLSTIGLEKQTNPFLRTNSNQIKSALGMTNSGPVDVFVQLRKKKDIWG